MQWSFWYLNLGKEEKMEIETGSVKILDITVFNKYWWQIWTYEWLNQPFQEMIKYESADETMQTTTSTGKARACKNVDQFLMRMKRNFQKQVKNMRYTRISIKFVN